MANIRKAESGFTLLEMLVVMTIVSMLAALLTPNFVEEFNVKRSDLTVNDTLSLADAARTYRSVTGAWPGGAGCTNAITQLTTEGYIQGFNAINRFDAPVTTSCDTKTFSIIQNAIAGFDGMIANNLNGTVISNPSTFELTTKIGIPGSEAGLAAKLSRVNTGDAEHNRMRTTFYLGGNDIRESGNINFTKADPVLQAESGSLTLSAQNGQIIIPAGQTLTVDDVILRSRGSRHLSSSLANFVHIGTYVVRNGWLVNKPNCPEGGNPKAALRPASIRGGFTQINEDPAIIGRFGFHYSLINSGTAWTVQAISEGYAADYANYDSLIDVYCFYSN